MSGIPGVTVLAGTLCRSLWYQTAETTVPGRLEFSQESQAVRTERLSLVLVRSRNCVSENKFKVLILPDYLAGETMAQTVMDSTTS